MIRIWSMSAQILAELQVDQQHGLAAAAIEGASHACGGFPLCLQQLLHDGVPLKEEDVTMCFTFPFFPRSSAVLPNDVSTGAASAELRKYASPGGHVSAGASMQPAHCACSVAAPADRLRSGARSRPQELHPRLSARPR